MYPIETRKAKHSKSKYQNEFGMQKMFNFNIMFICARYRQNIFFVGLLWRSSFQLFISSHRIFSIPAFASRNFSRQTNKFHNQLEKEENLWFFIQSAIPLVRPMCWLPRKSYDIATFLFIQEQSNNFFFHCRCVVSFVEGDMNANTLIFLLLFLIFFFFCEPFLLHVPACCEIEEIPVGVFFW